MDTKENILDIDIDDQARPEIVNARLYSRSAIFGFAFFFSTISAGIMMAMNLNALKKKDGLLPVLAFSILYPVIMVVISLNIELPRPIEIGLNIGAAYVMKDILWNKYIGKETEYEKRPIWIPLTICICLSALLLIWILSNM